MTVEIISWSISTKVWYRAGIELCSQTRYRLRYAARYIIGDIEIGDIESILL